jgi:UPF0716 protein FxsA
MHPIRAIGWGLVALPAAEIAAFVLVASLMGLSTAIVLLILVSLSGVLVLRRVGIGTMRRLRTAGATVEIAAVDFQGSDLGTALGGVLLVIPGFITGLLGAIVVFPRSRQWLVAALRRHFSAPRRRSDVLDLAPEEWHELPPRRLRRPGRKNS